MKNSIRNQRIYALLIIAGAGILLFRTLRMMLVERAFELLAGWVIVLLVMEFLVDLSGVVTSLPWLVSGNREKARLPLRLAAAATLLHAFRVLIYVLGRTGPWPNFDVKPAFRENYTFVWFWVYFAALLGFLGIVGVIVIWRIIRNREKNREN